MAFPMLRNMLKRSLTKINLRVFLVLTAILGSAVGLTLYHERKQREVVAAVREHGGMVVYSWDWDWERDRIIDQTVDHCPYPTWLVKACGYDFLGSVAYLSLNHPDFGDRPVMGEKDLLKRVVELKGLSYLDLTGRKQITDEDLLHLRSLPRLRGLNLSWTSVQGPGLVHLRENTSLTYLDLSELPLSDDDLEHLIPLARIKSLSLGSNRITDKGLRTLRHLKEIRKLELAHACVTGAELGRLINSKYESIIFDDMNIADLDWIKIARNLRKLTLTRMNLSNHSLQTLESIDGLQKLALGSNKGVDDAGLVHLSKLQSLEDLTIQDLPVTDTGILVLKSLTQLQRFILTDTHVTSKGIAELNTLLPSAEIADLSWH